MRSSRASRLCFALATILATVAVATTCGSDATGPEQAGPAAAMQIVAGDQQPAQVGTELPSPLVVKVLDAQGRVVRGQAVNFRVTSGGGSVFAGVANTNDSGVARERWTLGTSTADSQRVEARAVDNVTGAPLTFATFKATAIPGPAASASVTAGGSQSGTLGAVLPESLTVQVVDRYTNSVPGQWVRWSVLAGGGSISADSTATRADGVAKVSWTVGARLDTTHVARAVVGTVATLQFTATPQLPSTATITKTAGDVQTDTVAKMLPDSLAVEIELADGRPVVGARVRWSTGTGSGSARDSVSITGITGRASNRWILGTTAGGQSLIAGVAGLSSLTFSATALPGAAAALAIRSGQGQSATVASAVSTAPAVNVHDAYGNAVAGMVVTFVVASGGGTVTGSADTTGSDGIAAAGSWTLGTTSGANSLTATVTGLTPVAFTATGTAGPAFAVATFAGNNQSQQVAALLDVAPSVKVTDSYGNGVPSISVTFSVASGGGTLTDSVTTSDSSGVASVGGWRLGINPGGNTLAAAITGLPQTTVSAEGLPLVFASVSTGERHSCGVTSTGVIYCWGEYFSSSPRPQWTSQRFSSGSEALGLWHVCALTTSGQAYCWASTTWGDFGQRGTGSGGGDGFVSTSARFTQLSAGGHTTCGLTAAGVAYCWGSNSIGQIGDSTTSNRAVPVQVQTSVRFTSLSVGTDHVCGVGTDSLLICWGGNSSGQLGVGDFIERLIPTAVSGAHKFLLVSAGLNSTCAIATDGLAYCVGLNSYSQLGPFGPGIMSTNTFTLPVDAARTFSAIAVSDYAFNCAVGTDHVAVCWGSNYEGVLGTGSVNPGQGPLGTVAGGLLFESLSSGFGTTCARTTIGSIHCWGKNDQGQLGIGVISDYSTVPRPVLGQQ